MTKILIEKDIMVPMRDGVQLATDVYRLEGASPTPQYRPAINRIFHDAAHPSHVMLPIIEG
jgi:predicted acyl esterase